MSINDLPRKHSASSCVLTSAVRHVIGCSVAMTTLLGLQSTAHAVGEVGVLEEVIVTATKRAASVQDISGAVSALSAKTMEDLRLENIADAALQVPNVTLSTAGNHTPFIFIRGLGLSDFNAISVGSVGIYQDEVYMNSTAAQLQQMYDLQRIEVLRGPQGTLYGRNTTGGVINLVSNRPEQENSLSLKGSYGRYDQVDLEAVGNLAFTEELASRLAIVRHTRDAIFENTNNTGDATDADSWAARAMLRWDATEEQSWYFSLYGSKVDESARGRDRSNIAEHPNRSDPGKPRSEPLTDPGHEKIDVFGSTLIGNIDFSSFTLTSVTGFLNSERDTEEDIDSLAIDTLWDMRRNEADQFSQELRLASDGSSNLDWTVGLYYFYEDLEAEVDLEANNLFNATFVSMTDYTQETTTYALFSDLSYQLSERIELFGGLRWTYEEKDFETAQEGFFFAPFETQRQKDDWSEMSGAVGVNYAFSDSSMVYLKYSNGFRAGGFNAGGAVSDPSFDPETVESLELGYKFENDPRTLRLNLAAFVNDYKDMQVFALVVENGVPRQYLTNAAEASISGFEAEMVWQPTASLQFNFSAGILNTEFDEYIDGNGVDLSGNSLVGAPETTASGIVSYELPLSNGGAIRFISDVSYSDEYYFDNENTDRRAAQERTLVGARLAYEPEDRHYSIALWGRNLTDEEYFTRTTNIINWDSIFLGDPRTYGIEVRYDF